MAGSNSRLTPQQEAEMQARIRADPGFQRIANAQYATPMLRNSAINDYLTNHPASPLYGFTKSAPQGRGSGSYNYDADAGKLNWNQIISPHWYADPAVMGPIIVGAAGGMLGLGALPAYSPAMAGSAGVPAAAGAGVPAAAGGALPSSQIPGWTAAAMGGPAAITSQHASRGIPWGGAADVTEDYLGGRRRGPSGVGDVGSHTNDVAGALGHLSPLLQSAIAALSGLPALLAHNGPSDEEKALMEQARQMQAMQQKRIEHQNPLFQAVTQLAMSRLPGASQQPLGQL